MAGPPARHARQARQARPSPAAEPGTTGTLDRRRFLTYVVAASVLTVGAGTSTGVLGTGTAAAAVPSPPSGEDLFDVGEAIVVAAQPTMPLVQLELGADGIVRLDLPRTELGQGLTTSIAMLIAEELDLPLDRVRLTVADARPELLFNQITAGSATVRTFWYPARAMAAVARARLLAAAARQWGVDPDAVRLADGAVHGPAGLLAGLGELSAAAADTTLDVTGIRPKDPSAHRLIGTPTRRVDARDIVTGRKKFSMDIMATTAKPAMVKRPPTLKGTLRRVRNADEVRRRPGVLAVTEIDSGVAVVGETFEDCRAAVNALDVVWGPGPVDGEDNDSVAARLRGAGLPLAVPPLGALTVDAEFDWAPAAHAPLETECAVADVRTDSAEVWSGFQGPIVAQQRIALLLGLPVEKVTAHVVSPGGGFGRRGYFEGALEAVQVSRDTGMPIRLMWHRTDDMRHARARPQNHHRIRATLVGGQVVAYEQRVTGVALDVAPGLGELLTDVATSFPPGAQTTVGMQTYSQLLFNLMVSSPYHFGASTKTLSEVGTGIPTAAYRGVHCPTTRASEEIVVDEIAAALGRDPLEFRTECAKDERGRACLREVAELADWGRPMPAGFAQGLGYHKESRTFTACVAEIDGRDPKRPRVTGVTMVVDVGLAVNPLGVEAQVQGCIAEGISLTLRAGLHLRDGLPLEGSYSNYRWLRMRDYPADTTVHIMPGTDEPGGAGEVGVASTCAAVANAYARATGIAPRSFPIVFDVDFDPFPPGVLPDPPLA